MIKWGRKKSFPSPPPPPSPSSSPSSSSRPSSASHVFPMSWLSRFKNPKTSSETEARIAKGKEKKNLGSPSVLSGDNNLNGGRFYGRDHDSYWSLSFRKERLRGEKKISGGLKSVWYNSDDDALPTKAVGPTRGDDIPKFDDLVSERRKARELDALPRSFGCKVNIESTKAERALKDQKSRKAHRRIQEEEREFEKESARASLNSTKEKDMKTGGIVLRSETQGAFRHLSNETLGRTKQSRKVKAYSPRSAAKIECKIKAIEDMKRARIKMKKLTEERAAKDALNLDSCAVVKCSVDPRQDFRDSMIEMIREKGIRRAEELQDLLVCYLTWNCDEYHDLIVKVFREVWFELNEAELHQELEFVNC